MRIHPILGTVLFGAKVLGLAGAMTITAFSREPVEPTYQGWVEANFVYIGPDETGRVEKLSVREGDAVAEGAPLFTIDADRKKRQWLRARQRWRMLARRSPARNIS